MNVEYWDLFDETRQILLSNHKRGEIIPDGMYHLVVHSWIIDENNRFLISKRQVGRTDELKWERTGGSALAGESSYEAAVREVKEELGINIVDVPHLFVKSEKREKYHDFFDSWLFFVKCDELTITINTHEVCDYKWVSITQLEDLKKQGELVDSSTYYDEVYKEAICFKKHIY